MKIKSKLTRLLSLGAMVGAGTFGSYAQTPAQTKIDFPGLSGESQNVQKASGDPSPGPFESRINNYLFQDEQLNLDPNAGNVRVLRTDQKALVNDYVTATFEVKNVDTRELRNVLRTIVGLEGGRAEVIKDKQGNQQYVQVIAPRFMIPYLEAAVPALDEKWVREYDTGSADVYYKAKNRDATDIDFIAQLYASDSGFSQVDETNNSVSRIDEPYRIENYLKGAAAVDIPSNQVLLEVKIYEVSSNDDLKLGLDYINWKNGPGRNLFELFFGGLDADSHNKNFTSVFDPVTMATPGLGQFKLAEEEFTASYRAINYVLTSNYIDFLEVKGKARVINRQAQMVTSANTATFNTEDVLVALVSEPGDLTDVGPDSGGNSTIEGSRIAATSEGPVEVPSEVRDFDRRLHNRPAGSTGIFVSLTPFVGTESLELVTQVAIADLNGLSPNGQPIINTRDVTSTVRLFDGQPYCITGLKRTNDIKETAKAPGLGDIPVVGYLFGGEIATKRFNDVIIVVTPFFFTANQANISTPPAVKNVASIVGGGAVSIPANPIGYDQWLLDQEMK
jgi:Flp pilus assembly secretin CpaC